jgi:CDP-4-dehydro-6-deoxyglucose reductase
MSTNLKNYETKLIDRIDLTKDVYSIFLKKPNNFQFQPGQYIQFLIPQGEDFTPKSFSIVSSPEDDQLEFCIKKYPEGVASTFLYQKDLNTKIKFRGPLGNFTPKDNTKAYNFIATGVGLAPIMGLIEHLLMYQDYTKAINLLFGHRYKENLFWLDRLKKLSKNYENFNYRITLSQPKENWGSLDGRVTKHLDIFPTEGEFYICGNRDMVQDVNQKLIDKGINSNKINFEIF